MSQEPAIVASALEKTYGRGRNATSALRGVDLRIERGEFVSITGPSGSGKSTFLNLIGGLDRQYAGQLRVLGIELRTLSDRALARFRAQQLGFVFQAFHLLPHLTILENVLVPTVFSQKHDGAEKRAKELLERVGLGGRFGSKPKGLSGGQQQRVAIARALMNEGELLLCDEPTGALDSDTGGQILELLREVHEGGKRTVIVVTHDPQVSAEADREIAFIDGQIGEDSDQSSDGPATSRDPGHDAVDEEQT